LFPDFPVKFGRDIIAVAAIGAAENVLVVRSSLNVHNLSEFAQRARAKPNAISYATLGTGSSSHVAGIAFSLRAGCTILAVGYRSGADALKDLLADRVDAWFAPIPSVLGAVQTGQLVALSTTGPERAASLPDVPTISESGFPGYDVRLWTGVFARSGVPAERLRTMEQAIGRVLISPDFRMALQRQGIAPLSMSRDQFTAFVIQEVRSAKTIIAAFSKEEH